MDPLRGGCLAGARNPQSAGTVRDARENDRRWETEVLGVGRRESVLCKSPIAFSVFFVSPDFELRLCLAEGICGWESYSDSRAFFCLLQSLLLILARPLLVPTVVDFGFACGLYKS